MAPSTVIDYKIYFEFPNLTKIHGESTFDSIKTLHNELKTNSQTVPSNLGGGTHGHLGLVLNHQQYALLSGAPFIALVHPGTLVIPPGTTQHMTNTLNGNRSLLPCSLAKPSNQFDWFEHCRNHSTLVRYMR